MLWQSLKLKKNILHLQNLIKDIQIVKLDSLKRLIDLKIASSLEITVREQAGLSAAIEIISTQKGE
jgi:hypothetical protein